jgi:hypothetical protein
MNYKEDLETLEKNISDFIHKYQDCDITILYFRKDPKFIKPYLSKMIGKPENMWHTLIEITKAVPMLKEILFSVVDYLKIKQNKNFN